MRFVDCVKNIGTIPELKRIANAYVIDFKNLNKDELIAALIKTAPQYFFLDNVKKAYESLCLSGNNDERILVDVFLKEILLNKDDYQRSQRATDDEIIAYEQNIIDLSNELDEKSLDGDRKLLNFVLKTAWDQNDDLSPDEANLLHKLQAKLSISNKECRILEAKMGRFPKKDNVPHLMSELDQIRKTLQLKGLLFTIRDSKGENFDIIPEETAACLKIIFKKEMRDFGYKQMLAYKFVRNKEYLSSVLSKAGIKFSNNSRLSDLQNLVLEHISPSFLLCGNTLRDGLDREILVKWCTELQLPISGNKTEICNRIMSYYDDMKEVVVDTTDQREILLKYYEELANRDIKTLRKQGIIEKDLECEHKFEDATDYLFEKLLRNNPLMLTGTEHPDGILSYQNKLIMWDNKSKETPVKLKDHIMQFQRYIKNSEKPVLTFLVIAPDFTPDSIAECVKHGLISDTNMLLIKAGDLKEIALKWDEIHKKDDAVFNLGYFKQSGIFDKNTIGL